MTNPPVTEFEDGRFEEVTPNDTFAGIVLKAARAEYVTTMLAPEKTLTLRLRWEPAPRDELVLRTGPATSVGGAIELGGVYRLRMDNPASTRWVPYVNPPWQLWASSFVVNGDACDYATRDEAVAALEATFARMGKES